MNEDNQYLNSFERPTFVYRYVKGVQPSGDLGEYNFDIECSSGVDKNGNTVDTLGNRYVTGYLATLYLSEMAAQHDPNLGSAIQHIDAEHIKIYSGNLKAGFNTILKRLHGDETHNAETLDAIIKDISDGRYTSADDFGSKYIKGPIDENGYYHEDKPSLDFTLTVLNYMQAIDSDKSRQYPVNGSILFEFFGDFDAPIDLDPSENETAKRYTVIDSADYVYSTVSEDRAYATGGKSISGVPANTNTTISVAASGASASGTSAGAAFGASGDNSGTLSAAAKEATPAVDAEVEASGEDEISSEDVTFEAESEDSGEDVTEDEVVETSDADEEPVAEPADEEPVAEPTDEEPAAEPASFEEPIAEPASDEEPAAEEASEDETMTEEADSEESADKEISE